jgi:stage V sporulation protein SpoVS
MPTYDEGDSVEKLNDVKIDDVKPEEIKADEVGAEAVTDTGAIIALKVKADPQDITPEERKKNVKKLAGAISHSLRGSGEINVRCFGNASIGKGAKALAIAKNYINVQNQPLQLAFSPAFITTKMGDNELTGICFCTFATQKEKDVDLDKVKIVLMVKADPKDILPEDRKRNVKKLAGAITHALEENKEVVVRCFGNATIGKASKAMAIARGYVAVKGPDLYGWADFIVAKMGPDQQERTGIAFYVYTNATS